MWSEICSHISSVIGENFEYKKADSQGGGCINETFCLLGSTGKFFVKVNTASSVSMFEAESEGLTEMRLSDAIRIPKPLCVGQSKNNAYFVMEYIAMGGSGNSESMGEQLAGMHRKRADAFGWSRNNTIGSTAQINDWSDDWIDFYGSKRLKFQLDLAARNGATFKGGNTLLDKLPDFFDDYDPPPSLLHGDLWGGNASYDTTGNPVIYDPATYYGDREAEIAFTELFGGFGAGFYSAYDHAWPLHSGFERRKTLYNLYHILNHYNLFGGGYASQAQSMIKSLL